MTKVIGMLVALAMFCAMPALAFAQEDGEASNNEQNATIGQDGTAGDGGDGGGAAGGDDGGDAQGGDGGDGGSVGNQAAICQQNAGGDANCSIDQSQTVGGDTFVNEGDNEGDFEGDVEGEEFDNDEDNVVTGDVEGDDDDNVTFDNDGVGGGNVESVTLARTGFDAWVLALIGGVSLVGGLGLLAAQRRGRLNA